MDIGQVLSLRSFSIKTQKRTRWSPAILTELAWSIKDSMPSCCFVFSLLCLPVFIEKYILETHQRSSILREKSQKRCLLSRKIFSKRKFLCIRLVYGEIYCKNNTGNPERTVSLHLAHSGSQSRRGIWFILPTHGASHIVILHIEDL